MPSLEEISQSAAASAERTIGFSKAMDYAWLRDSIAHTRGENPHYLHDIIDAEHARLMKEING